MRFLAFIAALAVLACPGAGSGDARAAGTEGPVILVVEAAGTSAPEPRRREIRPAIEHAAKQAGATVVAARRVPASLMSGCREAACAVRAGKSAKATHVVLSEAAYVDDGFKIRLELYDVASGRQLSAEGQSCEVCTFPNFLKALRESMTLLCTRGLQGPQPEPATPPPSVPPPAMAAAPAEPDHTAGRAPVSTSLAVATAPPAREQRGWTATKTLAVAAVGAGLLTAGVGVFVLTQNGEPSCDGDPNRCPFRRNTAVGGSLLLGTGVVAAAGGGLLWWWDANRSTAVSLSPSGFVVSGRF
jgi:hypothetical protein